MKVRPGLLSSTPLILWWLEMTLNFNSLLTIQHVCVLSINLVKSLFKIFIFSWIHSQIAGNFKKKKNSSIPCFCILITSESPLIAPLSKASSWESPSFYTPRSLLAFLFLCIFVSFDFVFRLHKIPPLTSMTDITSILSNYPVVSPISSSYLPRKPISFFTLYLTCIILKNNNSYLVPGPFQALYK